MARDHPRFVIYSGSPVALGFASAEDVERRYDELVRGLQKLIDAITSEAEA